jgi:hypothetical protein
MQDFQHNNLKLSSNCLFKIWKVGWHKIWQHKMTMKVGITCVIGALNVGLMLRQMNPNVGLMLRQMNPNQTELEGWLA